ncbi:MAG: zinc-ribbon domain-containing protein, partial [Deltaproteobacteria bacterium]|nr:zinc-ribbon domain-containing protein [Deltaproteobacteria bacterium]
MLITCEECNSGFQLDDSRMKEEGVKVKCSKCSNVFMAYPPSSIESSGEDATGMQDFQDEPEGNEENDLDFSEMEAMLSSEGDLSLDTSSDEHSDITDSGFGFDETNELDLSDMDQLFKDDEVSEAESLSIEDPEELDLELDEVQDTAPSLGSTGSTNGGIEEIEELDFLDVDEELEEEVAPVEEVEELELELGEEKNTPVPEFEEETDFSIDGKSLGIEADTESEPAEAVEELGISDGEMEDMFSIDEQTDD